MKKGLFVIALFITALSLAGCEKCKHPSFTDWVVTTPATCEVGGQAERECTICHKKETKTIDPLGHNYVGGYCTVCGAKEPNN